MPPRKTATNSEGQKKHGQAQNDTTTESDRANKQEHKGDTREAAPTESHSKPSKKRKQEDLEGKSEASKKSSRRSARGTTANRPSQQQLLTFLISDKAQEICRPEDETEDIKARGDIKTYSSSVLSPFEELISAVILSRPISHRLGLRTIRTVLNPPYNFSSARAVHDTAEKDRHQALWDARTQHKAKTAEQLGHVAEVVLNNFTSASDKDGTKLDKLLQDTDNDVDEALRILKEKIKGIGPTGLDIFLRRVQWIWASAYPFVDSKTQTALKELDLPSDGEELRKALEDNWSKLQTKHLAGEDEAARKRRAFVIIAERATAAHLEGKAAELTKAAASA